MNHLATERNPDHNWSMSHLRTTDATVSLGRHQRNCSICGRDQLEEIEAAFVGWRSPVAIALMI
jgi:hypothetical protein